MAMAPLPPSSAGAVMWKASAVAAYPASSARISAPRACACSNDSRMRMADPSPMIRPSRSLSNGWGTPEARCVIAPTRSNAPTPTSMIVASLAPVMAASAIPLRMSIQAAPMPSAPEAQAEATEKFGPLAPVSIATSPLAPLDMSIGMAKGLMRRGPDSARVSTAISRVCNPPTAEQTVTATRCAFSSVICSPELTNASLSAAVASC